MQDYWEWFVRLSNKRQAGMGVSPIPFTEMKAFFDLNAISVEPYEVEVLEKFDRVALQHFHEKQEKEQAAAKAKSANK